MLIFWQPPTSCCPYRFLQDDEHPYRFCRHRHGHLLLALHLVVRYPIFFPFFPGHMNLLFSIALGRDESVNGHGGILHCVD